MGAGFFEATRAAGSCSALYSSPQVVDGVLVAVEPPVAGGSACVLCGAGFEANYSNDVYCSACRVGHRPAAGGLPGCEQVAETLPGLPPRRAGAFPPPTRFLSWSGARFRCRRCPVGHYSSAGVGCLPCPAGTMANADQSGCSSCEPAEFYDAAALACGRCSAGTQLNADRTGCEACPAGRARATDDADGDDGDPCYSCAAGKEPGQGRGGCVDCAAGRFSPAGGECADCAPGTHRGAGAAAGPLCTRCAAGAEPAGDQSSCVRCAPGHYSLGSGCAPCAAGQVVEPSGAGCVPDRAGHDFTLLGLLAAAVAGAAAGALVALGGLVWYRRELPVDGALPPPKPQPQPLPVAAPARPARYNTLVAGAPPKPVMVENPLARRPPPPPPPAATGLAFEEMLTRQLSAVYQADPAQAVSAWAAATPVHDPQHAASLARPGDAGGASALAQGLASRRLVSVRQVFVAWKFAVRGTDTPRPP